jgi:hypothetical protein
MAGLAAARALQEQRSELTITIFEKSRGLGGRVATRRREGFIFDHGAQCIKGPSEEVARFLADVLPADTLRPITWPVWTFDGAGIIAEGEARMNSEPNWAYADGLNRLGKLLGEGLDVRRELRVASVRQTTRGQWLLIDTNGREAGPFDAVLLTPPAPQIIEILASGELNADIRSPLIVELGRASYRRCVSLTLAYNRLVERPFYALVNTDRRHPIAWLGLEHTKGPERCPPGQSLLIAQMAPQWSVEHYETPLEAMTPVVAGQVSALLGEDLRDPLWADLQRWRYALPDQSADFDTLNRLGSPHGLFFAGDYTCDKGRIHLAIERGWQVADLIAHALPRF